MPAAGTYILTLKLDAASFLRLNTLRQQHFPVALNHLSAHLTLFHTLQAGHLPLLRDALQAAAPAVVPLLFTHPRSLGRGVAIEVQSPALCALRALLADRLGPALTAQDAQRFKPHVTVQNKVLPAQAHALLASLSAGFTPWAGAGEGVIFWRYLDGPWDFESQILFTPDRPPPTG